MSANAEPKTVFGVHPTWSLGVLVVLATILIFQWI